MHRKIGNTVVQVTPTDNAILVMRSEDDKPVVLTQFTWEEAEHLRTMLASALIEGKPKA